MFILAAPLHIWLMPLLIWGPTAYLVEFSWSGAWTELCHNGTVQSILIFGLDIWIVLDGLSFQEIGHPTDTKFLSWIRFDLIWWKHAGLNKILFSRMKIENIEELYFLDSIAKYSYWKLLNSALTSTSTPTGAEAEACPNAYFSKWI